MIRTWKEQQAHEWQVRKAWLQSLIDIGMTQSEAARHTGIDRGTFMRMCERFGIDYSSSHLPIKTMTDQQRKDYRALKRCGYTKDDALAAMRFGA